MTSSARKKTSQESNGAPIALNARSIAFVGAGGLAWSLVSGLLEQSATVPGRLRVCNRSDDSRLERFAALGVRTGRDKHELLGDAHTVVLAVKPQDAAAALEQVASHLSPGTLLVSAVAGLPLSFLAAALPDGVPLVRAMPNTSSLVGASATAVAAPEGTPPELVAHTVDLFKAVGDVYLVDEALLDAVTAVSGSGPAYFYYFTETLIEAAREVGLGPELAKALAVQTLQGAAAMLRQDGADPARLRAQVTSARGTTEAALRAMSEMRLADAIKQAVHSAARRSAEISAGFRKQPAKGGE